MTKRTVVFFTLLFLVATFNAPSWACTVTCGGDTCSGTGDCHCDVASDGTKTPHCTDASKALSEDNISYLRTWNLPGLNRMADAAEDMLEAIHANDLTAYQQALGRYSRAEAGLTKTEREIYSTFEAQPQPLTRERER